MYMYMITCMMINSFHRQIKIFGHYHTWKNLKLSSGIFKILFFFKNFVVRQSTVNSYLMENRTISMTRTHLNLFIIYNSALFTFMKIRPVHFPSFKIEWKYVNDLKRNVFIKKKIKTPRPFTIITNFRYILDTIYKYNVNYNGKKSKIYYAS